MSPERLMMNLDHREALAGGGADLLDAADAPDLGLELPGDEGLHVRGAHALIGGGDQDQGDLDFGKGLNGEGGVGAGPGHDDEGHQDVDGEAVVDGEVGEVHGRGSTTSTAWPSIRPR
jgi:hypothetical protein